MKKITFVLLFLIVAFVSRAQHIAGAWELKMGTNNVVMQLTDNYLTYTVYRSSPAEFYSTWGGPYNFIGDELVVKVEFNSADAAEVGKEKKLTAQLASADLMKVTSQPFKRIDEGNETALASGWQISARATPSGEMRAMPPAARKTLKILTGTRFQWIAMNTETGEFSGTGGGTYTLKNGVYTEHIEFFSRDNGRVGASLSFDAEVKGEDWIHSGKSSKGQPIKEVWSKIE